MVDLPASPPCLFRRAPHINPVHNSAIAPEQPHPQRKGRSAPGSTPGGADAPLDHPCAPHHVCIHIRRGVKAGDHDTGTLERGPEIYREHDLSQLALTIGSGPAIAGVSITSSKSIGCCPADETFTIRAGAQFLMSGNSSNVSRNPAR